MENKVFNFGGKTFAVALAAMFAGMSATSCEEDDNSHEQAKHSEYLNMYYYTEEGTDDKPFVDILNYEFMNNLAMREDIDSIFLVPCGEIFTGGRAKSYYLRGTGEFYGWVFDLSPKIKGRGPIYIKPGEASKVLEDSIFWTQHGCPVNPKSR